MSGDSWDSHSRTTEKPVTEDFENTRLRNVVGVKLANTDSAIYKCFSRLDALPVNGSEVSPANIEFFKRVVEFVQNKIKGGNDGTFSHIKDLDFNDLVDLVAQAMLLVANEKPETTLSEMSNNREMRNEIFGKIDEAYKQRLGIRQVGGDAIPANINLADFKKSESELLLVEFHRFLNNLKTLCITEDARATVVRNTEKKQGRITTLQENIKALLESVIKNPHSSLKEALEGRIDHLRKKLLLVLKEIIEILKLNQTIEDLENPNKAIDKAIDIKTLFALTRDLNIQFQKVIWDAYDKQNRLITNTYIGELRKRNTLHFTEVGNRAEMSRQSFRESSYRNEIASEFEYFQNLIKAYKDIYGITGEDKPSTDQSNQTESNKKDKTSESDEEDKQASPEELFARFILQLEERLKSLKEAFEDETQEPVSFQFSFRDFSEFMGVSAHLKQSFDKLLKTVEGYKKTTNTDPTTDSGTVQVEQDSNSNTQQSTQGIQAETSPNSNSLEDLIQKQQNLFGTLGEIAVELTQLMPVMDVTSQAEASINSLVEEMKAQLATLQKDNQIFAESYTQSLETFLDSTTSSGSRRDLSNDIGNVLRQKLEAPKMGSITDLEHLEIERKALEDSALELFVIKSCKPLLQDISDLFLTINPTSEQLQEMTTEFKKALDTGLAHTKSTQISEGKIALETSLKKFINNHGLPIPALEDLQQNNRETLSNIRGTLEKSFGLDLNDHVRFETALINKLIEAIADYKGIALNSGITYDQYRSFTDTIKDVLTNILKNLKQITPTEVEAPTPNQQSKGLSSESIQHLTNFLIHFRSENIHMDTNMVASYKHLIKQLKNTLNKIFI